MGGICFTMLRYSKNLKEPTRALRKELTDAEQLLWSRLRRKQMLGIQFYRQKPIGPYIVDFYAPAVKLVIEADGMQHLQEEQREYDTERDAFLYENGLLVLRFDNRQVLSETDAVIDIIFRVCEECVFSKNGGGISHSSQIPLNPPFSKGDFEAP